MLSLEFSRCWLCLSLSTCSSLFIPDSHPLPPPPHPASPLLALLSSHCLYSCHPVTSKSLQADSHPLPLPGPTRLSTGTVLLSQLTCAGQSRKSPASMVSAVLTSLSSIFLASDTSSSPGSQTPPISVPFSPSLRASIACPFHHCHSPSQMPCLQAHPLGSLPTRRCLSWCHSP